MNNFKIYKNILGGGKIITAPVVKVGGRKMGKKPPPRGQVL